MAESRSFGRGGDLESAVPSISEPFATVQSGEILTRAACTEPIYTTSTRQTK
jgi:hypothetical protein